jgi:hypothetical protein
MSNFYPYNHKKHSIEVYADLINIPTSSGSGLHGGVFTRAPIYIGENERPMSYEQSTSQNNPAPETDDELARDEDDS